MEIADNNVVELCGFEVQKTYYITKLYFAEYELFIENEFKVISFDVRLKNVVDLLAYW